MRRPIGAMLAMLVLLAPASASVAADHQVLMVNRDTEGRVMQFEPAFLKIAPGDTVTFIAKDKGHNAESLPDFAPAGAEAWKGKVNEEVSITFDVEGFYGYRCLPHAALGMVGLIQVGTAPPPPVAMADGLPGKAKTRMQDLIAQAQEQ